MTPALMNMVSQHPRRMKSDNTGQYNRAILDK